MIYIGFSNNYSFDEAIDAYDKINDCKMLYCLFELIGKKQIVSKNGSRVKKYMDKGGRKSIRIKRIVINKNDYYDLFPVVLIPNSMLKTEDVLHYDNDECFIKREFRNNSFERWLFEQKLDKNIFSKMRLIGYQADAFFYKSKKKYPQYETKRGIKIQKENKYIYLIYYKR